MNEIKIEHQFISDYSEIVKQYPCVKQELCFLIEHILVMGVAPKNNMSFLLTRPGGKYNGHIDYHIEDGQLDVIALYFANSNGRTFRFLRIGKHDNLYIQSKVEAL